MKKLILYAYDRIIQKVIRVKTEKQANEIANKGHPEYLVDCPKCSCTFGVN